METTTKVSTIQEILDLPNDGTVYAFKGMVKKIGQFFHAKEEGKQNFQFIILSADGKEIKAILKNRDEFEKSWLNQTVYFIAHQGQKGWSGLKAKDSEYQGKTNRVLWVTATAEISLGADYEAIQGEKAALPGQTPKQNASQGKPESKARPKSSAAEYLPTEDEEEWPDTATPESDKASRALSHSEAMKAAQEIVARGFNGMRIALRAAEAVRFIYEKDYGKELSPDHFRVITSTFFIQLANANVVQFLPAYAAALPPVSSKTNGEAKKPEPEPQPEPQPEIPF